MNKNDLCKIVYAYFEITNLCNLNCCSCYNRSGANYEKRELSLEQFSVIVSKLIGDYGCKRISLAGGEPTLHTEFDKFIDLLLSYPELDISVVTNGTTRYEKLTAAFRDNENLSVQVSLDGSCDEINAKTRGKGNFDKAVDFIKELRSAGRKPFVKMVISQNNSGDIEAFYDFILSLGCTPEFDFVNGMGNAAEGWESLGLPGKQKLQVLRLIDTLNKKYKTDVKLPVCTSSCPLVNSESDHLVLIKNDGTVFPCQMLYSDRFALGNLLYDNMEKFHSSFDRIAEIANKRMETDYNCGKCPLSFYCKKGCMAIADINTGNPLGDDGECGFRKLQLLGFHAVEQGVLM